MAALAAVAFLAFTRFPEQHGLVVFASVVAALLVYAHRGNIRRMLAGTESRLARPSWLRSLGGR
jgi:glycerol-3-phosphate acyltransferase PlsY